MKKIAIILDGAVMGGIETALANMLQIIDYSKIDVTLITNIEGSPWVESVPHSVKILNICNFAPKQTFVKLLKEKKFNGAAKVGLLYALSRIASTPQKNIEYLSHTSFFSEEEYDCAVAFKQNPVSITAALYRVKAKKRVLWIHGLLTEEKTLNKNLRKWVKSFNWIFGVSEGVVHNTKKLIPEIENRISVFLNILDDSEIRYKAKLLSELTNKEMPPEGAVRILSAGRFSHEKNFANIPYIVRCLLDNEVSVCWYLIGYGQDENCIREQIQKYSVENNVIILGKKENPYPYIAACDVYIQPSLHEGRSVAVVEAQILGKPVIITNYATAQSQLHDGVDGLIVPMEREACAKAIANILKDKELLQKIAEGTKKFDYCNKDEIKKLYALIED